MKFEITDADLKFYEKVSPVFGGKKYLIPAPTFCPDCRFQRRLSFRNERNLYRRKCDMSGGQILSMYSPDKPFPVYARDEWWSDKWDPLSYGRDFDFHRGFFEQFAELFSQVPRVSLNTSDSVNSDFCNFDLRNKNCYLLFTSAYSEDCYYSNRIAHDRNCSDCSNVEHSELCYECIDSDNCYFCGWLQNCFNSHECFLGYNLRSCNNCFGCHNLTNQSYYIYNKPYSKEEYRRLLPELLANIEEEKKKFSEQMRHITKKYITGLKFENCTGDAIYNSQNALNCYEVKELQDCKFVSDASSLRDVYDANNEDNSELDYEVIGSEENYMHCFNDICWFDKFSYYNSLCFNSQNIFGCVGLKKNSYCILNKQYSKEEYEALVPRIIEHMGGRAHGASAETKRGSGSAGPNESEPINQEWGEFFPSSISPYGYNETLANDFFPLSREDAVAQGFRWHETGVQKNASSVSASEKYVVPSRIQDTPDDITQKILTCEATGRPYKITPQELVFYRKMGLPVPRKHHDQRHKERMALRNPRRLWERKCMKCRKDLQSTYAPDRTEGILCEECYLVEV